MLELVNELYAFSDTTPAGQPSKNPPAGAVRDAVRPQTIAVMREALDALVVMLSPFAPHSGEELWQMLGHGTGLTSVTWPSFDAEIAKADELVVPVQINGKIRARLTVRAGLQEAALQTLILADPAVQPHRGQDDPQSRCGQRPADLDRRMRAALRVLCVLCVLCGGAFGSACGYALAGRGSTLPASIKTIGIPQFTNRTTVFNLETTLTTKVRSEFIGRGKWDIVGENNGDALLTGELTAISIQPSSINAAQLASRYAITMVARVELKDLKTNMVLWDNPSLVFRQE
jgi:hypothetical protein